jgi:site-specific DNA recombinase
MNKIKGELFDYLERVSRANYSFEKVNISYKDNKIIEKKLKSKKKELNNIDSRFDRQMEAYENEVIELEQLEKYKKRLKNEKKNLQIEVEKLKKKLSSKNTDISKIKNKLSDIISIIKDNNISLVERRKALKEIIDYIEYDRKQEKMQVNFIF